MCACDEMTSNTSLQAINVESCTYCCQDEGLLQLQQKFQEITDKVLAPPVVPAAVPVVEDESWIGDNPMLKNIELVSLLATNFVIVIVSTSVFPWSHGLALVSV